jgi:hypothetical protein
MSQWAARKEQSLAVRALWRFGPAAATAVLLAVPSLHDSAHSHGPSHRPAPATSGHIRRPLGPGHAGLGNVRPGAVGLGTVSTGPGRTTPPGQHRRPGHLIKPD